MPETLPTDTILIADDEPDVHAVTKLSLKSMKRPGRKLAIVGANSGEEAVEAMRNDPSIAVVLLDVVMENDSAGLDACRRIRQELGNRVARILLRTGQPGAAPERETIDNYDIDGYLPKAELTSAKLYSHVRTALRAHDELVELERRRGLLKSIHDCVVSLHSYEPLEITLGRVLDAATSIAGSPSALLFMEVMGEGGDTRRYFLHRGDAGRAEEVRTRIVRAGPSHLRAPTEVEGGLVVRLEAHRELGHGFLWVEGAPDVLARDALPVLAAHAANALYSSLAERILRADRGRVFETIDV